jgi:hypothetical protein
MVVRRDGCDTNHPRGRDVPRRRRVREHGEHEEQVAGVGQGEPSRLLRKLHKLSQVVSLALTVVVGPKGSGDGRDQAVSQDIW